jgi:hypothetical protein
MPVEQGVEKCNALTYFVQVVDEPRQVIISKA